MILFNAPAVTEAAAGDLVLLENQDRTRWNRAQINEGAALVEQAIKSRRFGPYALQAAISAVHAEDKWRSMTVMMVTTEGEQGRVIRALTAGAHEYLMKPFTPDSIVDKLALHGLPYAS